MGVTARNWHSEPDPLRGRAENTQPKLTRWSSVPERKIASDMIYGSSTTKSWYRAGSTHSDFSARPMDSVLFQSSVKSDLVLELQDFREKLRKAWQPGHQRQMAERRAAVEGWRDLQ